MSNLVLTAFAEWYATDALEKLIKEYNNPDLTQKGKRDLLHQALMFAVMAGHKIGVKEGIDAINACTGPTTGDELELTVVGYKAYLESET